MKKTIRFAPPNSMFFFEDPTGGKTPKIEDLLPIPRIWSTPSCIIVACLMYQDGETELTVSTSEADVKSMLPRFDGSLSTPSRVVEISTSERQILFQCEVGDRNTRVRIWTDHPSEPKTILAIFSELK